jgi:hypothetical protein
MKILKKGMRVLMIFRTILLQMKITVKKTFMSKVIHKLTLARELHTLISM